MASEPWPEPMGKRRSRVEMRVIMRLKKNEVLVSGGLGVDDPVTDFSTAGNMHDVTGDEAGLGGNQEDTGIGNDIPFRAIAEWMNVIEIFGDAAGIGLLRRPGAEHRRPGAGGADGVH